MRKVKRVLHPAYRYDLADTDEKARFLIGWPGYRTSRNKSGLAYAESHAELAHMQGLFIRWLVTGRFRTHNPIYLICMVLAGIGYGVIPLALILHELIVAQKWGYVLLLILQPTPIFGVLLVVNAILSIIDRRGETITGD